MAARGKTIALWSAGLGVLVLLAGAVVLRERILEEWHIHKLRTGSPEEARRAAEALGKMGSVRAVPALLEAPGRSRKGPGSASKAGRRVSIHRPDEFLGDSRGFQTLPFPATDGAEWQTAPLVTVLEGHDPGSKVLWDARSGNMVISLRESSGLDETLAALRWASAAIAQIGERAVPAIERAAADETLDPGTRAFASFQLARRALADPRLVLPEGGTEVSLEQRTSAPLPGSQGSVFISASDITRGRVHVWVTPSIGAPIIEEHALAEGEEVSFTLAGKGYVLRLVDLRNRLIGTDRAVFRIREDTRWQSTAPPRKIRT
jgi:hypothetical protein